MGATHKKGTLQYNSAYVRDIHQVFRFFQISVSQSKAICILPHVLPSESEACGGAKNMLRQPDGQLSFSMLSAFKSTEIEVMKLQ